MAEKPSLPPAATQTATTPRTRTTTTTPRIESIVTPLLSAIYKWHERSIWITSQGRTSSSIDVSSNFVPIPSFIYYNIVRILGFYAIVSFFYGTSNQYGPSIDELKRIHTRRKRSELKIWELYN
jgi:hypothetical protein